jgi:hypothetical protein
MVVMHAAWCVLLTVFAFMYVHTLRNSILIRPPGTAAILTFLVGLPVGCISFLAFQVRWWLRTSREQSVLEIRGDELLWSFPGFWATKLRRAPVESVRGVSLRAARTIGTLHAARVRVDFTNGRRLERPFFSGDPAFAEEVREAFAAAIGGARGQTQ